MNTDLRKAKKVVVMGAGIVGLASAYELQLAGYQVSVVDIEKSVGQGASGGNGAQLSYSYVQPLADPSIWAQLPKLLFEKNSPLTWRPSLQNQQARWLFEFLCACNKNRAQKTTHTLLGLGAQSRLRFECMLAELGISANDCDFKNNGKLVLYRTDESFKAGIKQVQLQKNLGLGGEQFLLTAQEARRLEPALAHSTEQLIGAVYTPSECVVDCKKLCEILMLKLKARGVNFLLGVGPGIHANDLVNEVTNDTNTRWVICVGVWSHAVLKLFGVRVPLYPIKGYSVTLPLDKLASIALSVTDSSRKLVFAPLTKNNSPALRIAGYAELVGMNNELNRAKIQSLVKAATSVFPHLASMTSSWENISPWTGFRPATPTGVPIVGRYKGLPSNVFLNIGHGALGLTLAFGTAYELSQLLAEPS